MTAQTSLVEALVAAQAAMETPRFDAVNPAFRSRYASLAEVTRVAKAALSARGVLLTQPITTADVIEACKTYAQTRASSSARSRCRSRPSPRTWARS